MGLTKLNFNEIQNASEAPSGININKSVSFKQQVILPTITPPNAETDGAIWVDEASGNLKVKVNLVTYDVSPKTDFNNISISSPYTFFLNGNTGIVNNFTITGTGTVVNVRSTTLDGPKWSNLEIKGNLTIDSGCTLNLIRTPIIVRGSILGSGVITSPNGANGGTGGLGGPGGAGGPAAVSDVGGPGGSAPTIWSGKTGSSGGSMDIEYGLSAGTGGDGGIGTAGGGGGGLASKSPVGAVSYSGGSSGNGNPGGPGTTTPQIPPPNGQRYSISGGGGGGTSGSGGAGSFLIDSNTPRAGGGSGSTGSTGNIGNSTPSYPNNFIGISNSSIGSPGNPGTFGGGGGAAGYLGSSLSPVSLNAENGSAGGSGGSGGAGGSTGGANISILSVGSISSTLTIRPGKGGINGGSTSFARAQTGNLYLFTPTGSEPVPGIDLTGGTGTPTGPNGTLNRVALSNASGVSDFYTTILFEASGPTPAKTKVSLTYP